MGSIGLHINDNNSLQTSLEKNHSKSSYIFLLDVNFENLIVGFHVFFFFNVFNTHVKIGCYLLFDQ